MFNDSKYIISITNLKDSPNVSNLNEYVFLGRSNVGKSSFINALTNKKILAKTSSKPGKTRTINYFLINDLFYLVDVPGYGYASTSAAQRIEFGNIIEKYLKNSKSLRAVFLLIDFKVGPTKDDLLMFDYLKFLGLKVFIVCTKIDKVGVTLRKKHLNNILEKLRLSENSIILTSSINKIGIDKVVELIKKDNSGE